MALAKNQLGHSEATHVDMLLYGRSKAGKTFTAATMPGPHYVLSPDPTSHKSIPFAVDGRVISKLSDLRDELMGLYEPGHGYKTLIVDGLWAVHDLFVMETGMMFHKDRGATDPDLLPIQGRMKIQSQFKKFLRTCIDLTQVENVEDRMHVVFTTLEERLKESEDAPFHVRPMIGTQAMNAINPAFFSVIGYIRPKGGDKAGGGLETAREMLFTEYKGIMAGDRLGLFPSYVEGDPINLSEYLTKTKITSSVVTAAAAKQGISKKKGA